MFSGFKRIEPGILDEDTLPDAEPATYGSSELSSKDAFRRNRRFRQHSRSEDPKIQDPEEPCGFWRNRSKYSRPEFWILDFGSWNDMTCPIWLYALFFPSKEAKIHSSDTHRQLWMQTSAFRRLRWGSTSLVNRASIAFDPQVRK